MIKYNTDIINKETKRSTKKLHDGNERWANYAQRLPKNPFVKRYLLNKYCGICQYCGLPIKDEVIVHHKIYNKECWTDTYIRVSSPTPNRPYKTRKVPDCEHCAQFHACIDDAVFPVHRGCNYRISKTHVT